MTQSGIFIVMKYPENGKVKLRLSQSIGEDAATGLYRAFIHDTLTTVQSLDVPYYIAVHPPESQEDFAELLGPSIQYFQQEGTDLGQRLQNGFISMFQEYQQVIALASDSPDLPSDILQDALTKLQTHDAVIGPATDGGYYLIGLSSDNLLATIFDGISWSTEMVLQETLEKIESITDRVYVLPKWADIDTKNDLLEFYQKYHLQPSKNLHTLQYLLNHPGLLQSLLS